MVLNNLLKKLLRSKVTKRISLKKDKEMKSNQSQCLMIQKVGWKDIC